MSQEPLADRIRNSGHDLDITLDDLASEIYAIAARKAADALIDLYSSLLHWRWKNVFYKDRSAMEVVTLSEFELAAAVADMTGGNNTDSSTISLLRENMVRANPPVGPVREFCRASLNYHPPNRWYFTTEFGLPEDLQKTQVLSYHVMN